jgi:hypothetical protein
MTIPNELQQRKAYEFYQRRLELGESGNSETDWKQAGEYLEKWRFIIWWWNLRKRRKAVSNFLFTDLPKNELMKLLGVPVILVIATGIITDNLQKNAKNNEIARQLEATQNERLIKYFDEMQDLIFNHKLMEAKPPKETVAVARTKTLTAIRLLDNKRNQSLIGFLQDSNFIQGETPVISLNGAYLKKAKLEDVNLENAKLEDAHLEEANLKKAVLLFCHIICLSCLGFSPKNSCLLLICFVTSGRKGVPVILPFAIIYLLFKEEYEFNIDDKNSTLDSMCSNTLDSNTTSQFSLKGYLS